MKKAVLAVVFMLSLSGGAQAFPGLFVYVPGADYDMATNNWVTNTSEFDVIVLSLNGIDNLNVTASTTSGEGYSGSLAIDGFGYSDADFTSGAPTTFGRLTTGIDSYLTHNAGSVASWSVSQFRLSLQGDGILSFDFWGFDRHGYLQHSFPGILARVGTASVVPEPATMLLFGFGLTAVALRQRRKSKLRKAA